ncbi:hypothetical protein SRHO_G00281190 [Serrasalmus rhombeus]
MKNSRSSVNTGSSTAHLKCPGLNMCCPRALFQPQHLALCSSCARLRVNKSQNDRKTAFVIQARSSTAKQRSSA